MDLGGWSEVLGRWGGWCDGAKKQEHSNIHVMRQASKTASIDIYMRSL